MKVASDQSRAENNFSLLEVLMAITIIAVAMSLVLHILGTARDQFMRAEQRWSRRHVAEQATEFFLLAGPAAIMPDFILPEGFSTRVVANPASSGWPDVPGDPVNGWLPIALTVEVLDQNGEIVVTQTMEKLWHTDDL